MSVHGTLSRQMEMLSWRWQRHIPEQGPTNTLAPGWRLDIALPFVNVELSYLGWFNLKRKPHAFIYANHDGADFSYAGFSLGIAGDTGNDGGLEQGGDCTVLG